MTESKKLHVPYYVDGGFICHTINKTVTKENALTLNPTEARAAMHELQQAASGLSIALETARKEDLSGIRDFPAEWARKANHLRDVLYELINLLKAYEDDKPLTPLDKELKAYLRRTRRRQRRQCHQANTFVDLVAEIIGEPTCKALLAESGHIADKLADSEESTPPNIFD